MLWTHTTQGNKHLLYWRRKFLLDAGTLRFLLLLSLLRVNANLGEHNFVCVEAVGPILKFRRLISRELINNPYLITDNQTPEKIKRKINKHYDIHVLINIPRGKK